MPIKSHQLMQMKFYTEIRAFLKWMYTILHANKQFLILAWFLVYILAAKFMKWVLAAKSLAKGLCW